MSLNMFLKGIAEAFSGKEFTAKDLIEFVTRKDVVSSPTCPTLKSTCEVLNVIPKTRSSCENNWSEMVFAVKILYPDVKTKGDVLGKLEHIKTNTRFKCSGGGENINRYFIDIDKRKEKVVLEYIRNMNPGEFNITSIKSLILSGKTIEEFPELYKINICKETGKLYDVKKRKSDIYIISSDNIIIGISVKSDSKCTLTNYSIERMLGIMNLADPMELKQIRINMLKEHFGNSDGVYKKNQRRDANKLFHDKDNKYFKELNRLIIDNVGVIGKKLLEFAFPKLPYNIYGYSGKKIIDLNKLSDLYNNQKLKLERNKGICGGKQRDTVSNAKVWYSVYLNGCEKYYFEIRFKNDIYGGSSQIFLYKT